MSSLALIFNSDFLTPSVVMFQGFLGIPIDVGIPFGPYGLEVLLISENCHLQSRHIIRHYVEGVAQQDFGQYIVLN